MDNIFSKGVVSTAQQATDTAQAILKQFDEDRKKIEGIGKAAASAMIVHNYMQIHPLTEARQIPVRCNLSLPTVLSALTNLQKLNIIKETTGKERNRIYAYKAYIDILSQGTEPLEK
jgi:Fic family protein